MTGWGQDGPLADTAGHDLTYAAVAGALAHIGRAGQPPTPPLNLVADFGGGGMLLALGLVAGLLHAQRTGEGQVVDAAMVDGTALLMAPFFGASAMGFWSDERGTNLLDSGAPYYDVYRCADGAGARRSAPSSRSSSPRSSTVLDLDPRDAARPERPGALAGAARGASTAAIAAATASRVAGPGRGHRRVRGAGAHDARGRRAPARARARHDRRARRRAAARARAALLRHAGRARPSAVRPRPAHRRGARRVRASRDRRGRRRCAPPARSPDVASRPQKGSQSLQGVRPSVGLDLPQVGLAGHDHAAGHVGHRAARRWPRAPRRRRSCPLRADREAPTRPSPWRATSSCRRWIASSIATDCTRCSFTSWVIQWAK